MAPLHLQGLNLVYADPQPTGPYISDADLLAIPNYPPELSAQLDLWTNLAFQSDESSLAAAALSAHSKLQQADDDDDDDEHEGPARAEGHENVVTGTVLEQPPTTTAAAAAASASPMPSQLDLMAFLATIGMPPHVQGPNRPPLPPGVAAPSLASILSLYSSQSLPSFPPSLSAAAPASPVDYSAAPASAGGPSRAKRARTRKADDPSVPPTLTADTAAAADDDEDDDLDGPSPTGHGPTAVEDKRRRNTAASARFRAKKKEREAALEQKSKDLEGRVSGLERECEALRRENGWLKGLVVGVTGAGAGQAAVVGQKRTRDD